MHDEKSEMSWPVRLFHVRACVRSSLFVDRRRMVSIDYSIVMRTDQLLVSATAKLGLRCLETVAFAARAMRPDGVPELSLA